MPRTLTWLCCLFLFSKLKVKLQNSYLKLLLGLLKALGIGRVDDVDEDVRVVKVIPPVRTDLPLPANVPDVQPEPWRLDGLDVEALDGEEDCQGFSRRRQNLGGGDCWDVLAGKILQDCCLAGIVEPQQKDPQVLFFRRLQLSEDYSGRQFQIEKWFDKPEDV